MTAQQPRAGHIAVLIIDDHPIVRESLSRIIAAQSDMRVAGAVGSRKEAYEVVATANPDVVVIDVALADAHGLDLVRDFRTQFEDIRFVVFSMYDERLYAERAIQNGAHGYVMKSQPTELLLQAIRLAATNDYFVSKPVLSRILRKMGPGSSVSDAASPITSLTDRELEVYQLIGQGQDASTIADRLSLSRKTVETYRRRIKEKLELESLTALMQHAMRWTDSQSSRAIEDRAPE
ncbi:MAG: response regulator transcription factor [Bacteroidetes bacterium]|nr:response regulator transcription factor [Bacteroidota bacterium]